MNKYFSRAALLGFLSLIGCGYLASKGIVPGFFAMCFILVGFVVMLILMYLAHAVWRCPSCKKQMGTKTSIAHCPSCGHQLLYGRDHHELDERVREFVHKSERPTSKEKLVENLQSKIIRKKLALWIFYLLCGCLVLTAFVIGVNKVLLGIWFFCLIGYLLYNFTQSRCPLCHAIIEHNHKFCARCGLGSA